MGGDNAPAAVISGADTAKAKAPQIIFVFVGDEALIRPLLAKTQHLKDAEILHTSVAVALRTLHHRQCDGAVTVRCGLPSLRLQIKNLKQSFQLEILVR